MGKPPRRSRFAHSDAATDSFYDFDTLILRLDPDLFSEAGGQDDWDYQSAVAHETTHWHQHHGTSLGAFLTGIRWAQLDLLLRARVGAEQRGDNLAEFSRWFVAEGPLIRTDDDVDFMRSGHSSLQIGEFRDGWLRMQRTHAFFLDADVYARQLTFQPADLAYTLAHVTALYSALETGPRDSRPRSMEEIERAITRKIELPEDSAKRIVTTRALLEASCLVGEAHLLEVDTWYESGEMAFSESARQRLMLRMSDPGQIGTIFGDFRRLVSQCGFLNVRVQDLFRTFCLLCDVALNPPLPPLVSIEPDSWHTQPLSYRRIHPVGRFYSMIERLRTIGLYRGELDAVRMLDYQRESSYAAGFDAPSDYRHMAHALAAKSTEDLVALTPTEDSYKPELDPSLIDPMFALFFSVWTQTKYWEHRTEALPSIVFGHGAHYSQEIEHWHPDRADAAWFSPLIVVSGEEGLASENPRLALYVLQSTAILWASFGFVSAGKLEEAEIPRVCRPFVVPSINEWLRWMSAGLSRQKPSPSVGMQSKDQTDALSVLTEAVAERLSALGGAWVAEGDHVTLGGFGIEIQLLRDGDDPASDSAHAHFLFEMSPGLNRVLDCAVSLPLGSKSALISVAELWSASTGACLVELLTQQNSHASRVNAADKNGFPGWTTIVSPTAVMVFSEMDDVGGVATGLQSLSMGPALSMDLPRLPDPDKPHTLKVIVSVLNGEVQCLAELDGGDAFPCTHLDDLVISWREGQTESAWIARCVFLLLYPSGGSRSL